MSSTRGSKGRNTWSDCSLRKLPNPNQDCLNNEQALDLLAIVKSKPGEIYDADRQCQLFLQDSNAKSQFATLSNERINEALNINLSSESNCNETIVCKSAKFGVLVSIGPALEGTRCGINRQCVYGACQLSVF